MSEIEIIKKELLMKPAKNKSRSLAKDILGKPTSLIKDPNWVPTGSGKRFGS